ncbi:MAG: hypothetical protein KC431_06425 [Myxococcales bacterium]|nr:hypothetical protein [Myxococcales bacterium]
MSAGYQISLRVVVLVIAISAPLALGIETLLRTQVLVPIIGPDLDEVRAFFSPQTTMAAWAMVGVCVLAGLLGLALLRRAIRRDQANAEGTQEDRTRKLKDRLLLLTSVPQVPAILATLCFMAGSELTPVLISMAVSTAFVIAMGFLGEASLRPDQAPDQA